MLKQTDAKQETPFENKNKINMNNSNKCVIGNLLLKQLIKFY